jgi:hypothetical protein
MSRRILQQIWSAIPSYSSQHGSGSIMRLALVGSAAPESGYVAAITLGIESTATPSPIGISGTVN